MNKWWITRRFNVACLKREPICCVTKGNPKICFLLDGHMIDKLGMTVTKPFQRE